MQQFQEERMCVAAQSLLGMERCISQTVEYCQRRDAFGQPLIANQAVRCWLAERSTEVDGCL